MRLFSISSTNQNNANRAVHLTPMPSALLSHILLPQDLRQKQVGAGDSGRSLLNMLRLVVLLFAILLPLRLEAIDGTIAISEVNIFPKSISLRFKGYLEKSDNVYTRFDGVYMLQLLRSDSLSDSEWLSLQEEFTARLGKTVTIDIQSKHYASRGPVLTIWGFDKIKLVDEK